MSIVKDKKVLNLVLGGGGIKGIAYTGAFSIAEKRGYGWGNIAGVSAGALAGSFIAAGYTAQELVDIMGQFDFSEIDLENIQNRVPAVNRYKEIKEIFGYYDIGIKQRLAQNRLNKGTYNGLNNGPYDELYSESYNGLYNDEERQGIQGNEINYYRSKLIKNIILYYKNGCLLDGDYLEEWVSSVLAKKGIRTFGDLKNGTPDLFNPKGYKIRMTAVDANRGKVIVLPDDMDFYGINPDEFEVAKAVRMSTSVPFVFKPVEIKKVVNNKTRTYNIIDGGVLDKLPYWLIENKEDNPEPICFTLGGAKKKINLSTPLGLLKDLISSFYDIGVPKNIKNDIKYFGEIDTTGIDYLDFNLSDEEKLRLYESGIKTAVKIFDSIEEESVERDKSMKGDSIDSNNSISSGSSNTDRFKQKYDVNNKQAVNNKQGASILILLILLYLTKTQGRNVTT